MSFKPKKRTSKMFLRHVTTRLTQECCQVFRKYFKACAVNNKLPLSSLISETNHLIITPDIIYSKANKNLTVCN